VKPFSAVTERCMESYKVSDYSQEVDNKGSQASVLITEKYSRRYSEV
jgi:hypothetical protein